MIKKIYIQKLKNAEFTIVVKPFPDELFSSWIVRTAYAHHTHPHTFANLYIDYRYNAFFRTDPDVSIDDYALKAIEKQSANRYDLQKLTLKIYSGYLQEEIHPYVNLLLSGFKLCPLCFKEDHVAYFRKMWRVEFYNICHRHGCYLLERCPKCGKRIDPTKMYKDRLPYTFCRGCGYDFTSRGSVKPAHEQALKSQNRIMRVLKRGYIVLDKKPVYSFFFFEVFNHLVKLIWCWQKRSFVERHVLYEEVAHIECKNYIRGKPLFKQLTVEEKAAVFSIVMFLFERYPKSFREFVAANGIVYWDLVQDMRGVRFWYLFI